MSYDEEDLGNRFLIKDNSTNPQSSSTPSDSTQLLYRLLTNIAIYNQYSYI